MASIPPSTSIPRQDEIVRKAYSRIRDTISVVIHYSTILGDNAKDQHRAIEDVIKPSIKTFLETCDTNPQVAAIVATPALLAILLTLAFLVLSTLFLVVWTVVSISLGIVFVIVGGLVSLSVKLIVVAIATLPLAGIATGLLIAGNYVAQFITKELLVSSENFTIKGENWQKFAEASFKQSIRFMKWASSGLSTVGLATFSAVQTAAVVLHDAAERDAAALANADVNQASGQAEGHSQEVRPTSPYTGKGHIHAGASQTSQEDGDSEVVFVEPEPVTIPDAQPSNPNIKQRNPFKSPQDDAES